MVDRYRDYLLEKFEEYKNTNQELVGRIAHLEAENNLSVSELQLCKKKCLLYKKERDCYRTLIESYEAEVNGDNYFGFSKDAFTKLDNSLVEYEGLVENLQHQVKNLQVKLVKIEEDRARLQGENMKLKASYEDSEEKLNQKYENLKRQYEELTENIKNIEKGESSDTRNFRIIHLKENPVDNRIIQDWENYQFLIEENKRLITRLDIIQSGHNADLTRMVNEEINYSSEIEHLREALSVSETKRLKLYEEFKTSVKEFREFIICLTGYKIDKLKTDKQYKVSFAHAENPSEYLLFKTENKGIELLETDFSQNLTSYIELYLQKYDSYPAFLAALSLDLFKKANSY